VNKRISTWRPHVRPFTNITQHFVCENTSAVVVDVVVVAVVVRPTGVVNDARLDAVVVSSCVVESRGVAAVLPSTAWYCCPHARYIAVIDNTCNKDMFLSTRNAPNIFKHYAVHL